MLIRVFGLYWNPDAVDWGSRGAGNKGRLLGKAKVKSKNHPKGKTLEIDFWKARGIYVLYDGFKPVYVGKAWADPLGKRVRDHLTDRFAGRWDMFSWFSTSTMNSTSKDTRTAGARQVQPEEVVSTLEALSILVTEAPLNRKRETMPESVNVEQKKSPHPHTIRHYLEKLIEHHKIKL